MRVVVPPVLVDDRIVRIVSPVASLLEVEEWVGAWWEPSGVTLTQASVAPVAPDDVLDAHGVPREDCETSEPRPAQIDIEALIHTRDPERPEQMRFDDESVARVVPTRRRKYPGNARFRRHSAANGNAAIDPERRKKKSADPATPRRRASDHPPRGPSDPAA